MKINIKGLTFKVSVGIYEHEKSLLTKIVISTEVFVKKTEHFEEETIVDYDRVISSIKEVSLARHYDYIEDLAHSTKGAIKKLNANIEDVKVKVQKCIMGNIVNEISVEV